MSPTGPDDTDLSLEQRDLPPGLHAKVLVVAGVLLTALALLAMRFFL